MNSKHDVRNSKFETSSSITSHMFKTTARPLPTYVGTWCGSPRRSREASSAVLLLGAFGLAVFMSFRISSFELRI